jgi:hypothetical protein
VAVAEVAQCCLSEQQAAAAGEYAIPLTVRDLDLYHNHDHRGGRNTSYLYHSLGHPCRIVIHCENKAYRDRHPYGAKKVNTLLPYRRNGLISRFSYPDLSRARVFPFPS